MWNPTLSVVLYFPRRSMIYAICCGTTTAVLARTISTRIAKTKATMTAPLINHSPAYSTFDPEGQTIDALHGTALSAGDPLIATVTRIPGGPAQLDFAEAVHFDVVHGCGCLAHQRIDFDIGIPRTEPRQ